MKQCFEQECAPPYGYKEDCELNQDGLCIGKKPCDTCANAGWDTMAKVAACNCCEAYEFYSPQNKNSERG